jgi:hypothetical protein
MHAKSRLKAVSGIQADCGRVIPRTTGWHKSAPRRVLHRLPILFPSSPRSSSRPLFNSLPILCSIVFPSSSHPLLILISPFSSPLTISHTAQTPPPLSIPASRHPRSQFRSATLLCSLKDSTHLQPHALFYPHSLPSQSTPLTPSQSPLQLPPSHLKYLSRTSHRKPGVHRHARGPSLSSTTVLPEFSASSTPHPSFDYSRRVASRDCRSSKLP